MNIVRIIGAKFLTDGENINIEMGKMRINSEVLD